MEDVFASLGENEIEFISFRPPGSKTAILDRQIRVTGPQELVDISESGDLETLKKLISCLKDKDRAWNAVVLLSAMTGRDGTTVEIYSATPSDWWDTHGDSAHDNWDEWYKKAQENLKWDDESKLFIVQ